MDIVLRECAPVVLASLVRRHGTFGMCEDAVQEALLAAAMQWPEEGIPANPEGWLTTVASRRWIELWRNDAARRRREEAAAALAPVEPAPAGHVDDTLNLFLLCCHPSLSRASQIALTLRAVGGLTTAEVARALLVPEPTVAQRISRAKQRIKADGVTFTMPAPAEYPARVAAVLQVLYLIFNEGYTASSGPTLNRADLTTEAIRLARQLHELLPGEGEVAGLLALMLLTDARRPARSAPDGSTVPLAEQKRELWDRALIDEGIKLITRTLAQAPLGPYQVQAAIAAVHDEAADAADTDWPQILGLYNVLRRLAPGPMVTLNRVVAVAMTAGPDRGLAELALAESDPALAGHYRTHALRAHLLELTGDPKAACAEYEIAAKQTLSIPEQRYLRARAARLNREHVTVR
jgi:predicted RNA polymerase sigma factor